MIQKLKSKLSYYLNYFMCSCLHEMDLNVICFVILCVLLATTFAQDAGKCSETLDNKETTTRNEHVVL